MTNVYLSLGTNLGNKDANMRTAIQLINEQIGEILSQSAFYITAPWGFQSENSFLNSAICIETDLSPFAVLKATQQIEQTMGRTHKSINGKYTDRLIDIDILLYDQLILQSEDLILPHPLLTERQFVLEPLAEIASEVKHPILKKSIGTLFKESQLPPQ